jgi:hypothetical protein
MRAACAARAIRIAPLRAARAPSRARHLTLRASAAHNDNTSSSSSSFPVFMAAPVELPEEVLHRDVVVVGGGVGAGYIARAFAEAGQGHRLALISDDAALPYERPALVRFTHAATHARTHARTQRAARSVALRVLAFFARIALTHASYIIRRRSICTRRHRRACLASTRALALAARRRTRAGTRRTASRCCTAAARA